VFRTRVAGTGSYLPPKKLTNKDLERLVDTSDEWITERTGIRERSFAEEGQGPSDLALEAAKIALSTAKMEPKDLEAILFATVSPDQIMPNTACFLQQKLGARDIMSVDLSAACSGFLYGLTIADQFIRTGSYKTILVVGAEVLHHYVDYRDRNTCILFGDGAGAFVVTRAEDDDSSTIYSHHLHADGQIGHLLELKMGGSRMPPSREAIERGDHFMKMKGREIFKHAVRTMSQCCEEALTQNKMKPSDVDWVVPHQANTRIIEGVASLFGIPMSKVIVEIEDMGNTSAATVPIAFDRAVRDGRIQRGQNVLLTAFGAGITSGSVMMRY
jgi:3-oxoacyl-[acyl-carrier-protein] synthase III